MKVINFYHIDSILSSWSRLRLNRATHFFPIAFLFFASYVLCAQKAGDLPNIVIFIADDAGMDFGAYGNNAIQTPHIDRLAQEGLRAENAFLTSPQCSPTRTSILSGQFAHTIGTEDLHTPIDQDTKLLPHYLQQEGYYTGLLMKTHIGEHGEQQFNTIIRGKDQEAPQLFTQFLDSTKHKPFFCWVAFRDPHRPYGDKWDGAAEVHHPEDVLVPPYFVDDSATRKDIALYYDEIHRMDKNIGAMLEELEKRELRNNTLVIFLSDNGMPFPRGKGTLYDFGIQTPLIFHWAGNVNKNVTYSELISVIDLAPTILDIAGIAKPANMYGESIAQVFQDQSIPGRDFVFAERNWHDTDAHMRCIRSQSHKLIVNGYPELAFPIIADFRRAGSWWDLIRHQQTGELNEIQRLLFESPRYKVELYDIQNDPLETTNLIIEESALDQAYALLEELQKWQKATGDYPSHQKRRNDYIDRQSAFKIINWNAPYNQDESAYWMTEEMEKENNKKRNK